MEILQNEKIQLAYVELEQRAKYNKNCITAGTFLGFVAMLLAGYGIFTKADLKDVALVISPIAALAGVFIWGYKKENSGNKNETL